MGTSGQPPNIAAQGTYQPVPLGGTLVMPSPLPNVVPFPLRPDEFLTFSGGEMSAARSIRDACIGAFATGAVGIAGVLATIDWDSAQKEGRHPTFWTVALFVFTVTAFVVGLCEWVRMYQTHRQSAYSRLVQTIANYFHIPVP